MPHLLGKSGVVANTGDDLEPIKPAMLEKILDARCRPLVRFVDSVRGFKLDVGCRRVVETTRDVVTEQAENVGFNSQPTLPFFFDKSHHDLKVVLHRLLGDGKIVSVAPVDDFWPNTFFEVKVGEQGDRGCFLLQANLLGSGDFPHVVLVNVLADFERRIEILFQPSIVVHHSLVLPAVVLTLDISLTKFALKASLVSQLLYGFLHVGLLKRA